MKIVGEIMDEKSFIIAGKEFGFWMKTLDQMHQILACLPQEERIQVGSLTNNYVKSIKIKNCITREGILTSAGNIPLDIIGMMEDLHSGSDVIINGVNLGRADILILRCRPHGGYKEWSEYVKFVEDVAVIYLQKIDFMHILPLGGLYSRIDAMVNIALDYLEVLCGGYNFFKLCGKAQYGHVYSMSKEYASNWFYGYASKGKLKVLDLEYRDFPLTKFLDTLEREGYIDIPLLTNHDKLVSYGKGGYSKYSALKGKHTYYPNLIEAFRKYKNIQIPFLEVFDPNEPPPYVYEVEEMKGKNGYHIIEKDRLNPEKVISSRYIGARNDLIVIEGKVPVE